LFFLVIRTFFPFIQSIAIRYEQTKQNLKRSKILSDSNICRNAESSHATSQEQKMVKITGTLTSRIETKNKENKPYYYGFFKIKDQQPEIPVI